jgi:putative SOS response-associated peptidase YedK
MMTRRPHAAALLCALLLFANIPASARQTPAPADPSAQTPAAQQQQGPRARPTPDPNDPVQRIRDEALNRSQVMQTLSHLTNIIGPRLTGSPGMRRANEWTRDRLTEWGLVNAKLEPWGAFGRGWTLRQFSAAVVEPQSFPLMDKPGFRNAVRRRRCIFLADGFYEWQRQGKTKMPFLIRMRDGGPMLLAGIWETFHDPSGGEIDTAAIVTTTASGKLTRIHDRMPVILGREEIARWLDNDERHAPEAFGLVRPCPDEWLDLVSISSRVNSVANDDPDVQAPLLSSVAEPVRQEDSTAARPRSNDEDAQGRLF